eukprot:602535-Pleurochrysis_carterae.AAC.1
MLRRPPFAPKRARTVAHAQQYRQHARDAVLPEDDEEAVEKVLVPRRLRAPPDHERSTKSRMRD